MDWINALLRTLIGGYVSLFGEAHPLVSLVPLSVLAGIGMLWVFGRVSNQEEIRRTRKKLQAYLLELRLFGDEPGLIWRAQRNLLLGNFKYIGLMLKPALILTAPMVLLLVHLDAFYGRAPLPLEKPAVLTVQLNGRLANNAPAPELTAPEGLAIETPAVRLLEEGQFSWRVRPKAPAEGTLTFLWNGARWEKSVVAGHNPAYVSPRRVASWMDAILYPGESTVDVQHVEWVEVPYPIKEIEFAGTELHWLIWFLVLSLLSAYLLKGRFNVAV